MYALLANPNGFFDWLQAGEETIPMDSAASRIGGFVEWFKKEMRVSEPDFTTARLPNARLFFHTRLLFDFCKNKGIMLFAD
jgi:hypothetical protein